MLNNLRLLALLVLSLLCSHLEASDHIATVYVLDGHNQITPIEVTQNAMTPGTAFEISVTPNEVVPNFCVDPNGTLYFIEGRPSGTTKDYYIVTRQKDGKLEPPPFKIPKGLPQAIVDGPDRLHILVGNGLHTFDGNAL